MINNLLEKPFVIAAKAHEGQKDKAGAPYIFHPIRVSNRCRIDEEKNRCIVARRNRGYQHYRFLFSH